MYCLKCRRVTETEYITTATSKNCRLMRRGQCITCEKTKTQFIKSDATGGSFLNTLVSKLPFEMHIAGHKRLNLDRTPREWSMPINRVYHAVYHHDLFKTIQKTIQNMMILKL